MSTVHEIERAVERLSLGEFRELASWLERHRTQREAFAPQALRDHAAFLGSYAPEDEGLYDDAAPR